MLRDGDSPITVDEGAAAPPFGSVPVPARQGGYLRTAVERARAWVAADQLAAGALAGGLVLRAVYWGVTGRKFEDALITVTHAQSVMLGVGLTHHAGEPVTQGFTSALSVLVPLLGYAMGTFVPHLDGFLLLRIASMVAYVFTILAATSLCHRLGVRRWGRAFALLFLAVDYNQIFYGMSGMETQMAVAILLWAILTTMDRAPVRAGVMYALCLLVRPEFALFVGVALISLLLWNRRGAVRAALVTLVTVGPWLIFTTAYYGSPEPNTIKAKALAYHVSLPATINPATWINFLSGHLNTWWHYFTPFLENDFVVHSPLSHALSAVIAGALIALCLVGAVVTRHVPGWRATLVFMAVFTMYRAVYLPETYFSWYYPPFIALVVICAGAGLTRLATVTPPLSAAPAIGLTALFAWPLPAMVALDRDLQGLEDKVRTPAGLWIRHHVPPGQVVTSESAGYIGFYGRALLYDYPGLTSKRALAIFERLGWRHDTLPDLVNAARPAFAVFRPLELDSFVQRFPRAAAYYVLAARFAVQQSSWTFAGVTAEDRDDNVIYIFRRGSVAQARAATRMAPVVERVGPADRATNVPVTARIFAVFGNTEPDTALGMKYGGAVDRASTASAFTLRRSRDGRPVRGVVIFYGQSVPIFVPSAPLAPRTSYTAAISSKARLANGVKLPAPVAWRFTTAADG